MCFEAFAIAAETSCAALAQFMRSLSLNEQQQRDVVQNNLPNWHKEGSQVYLERYHSKRKHKTVVDKRNQKRGKRNPSQDAFAQAFGNTLALYKLMAMSDQKQLPSEWHKLKHEAAARYEKGLFKRRGTQLPANWEQRVDRLFDTIFILVDETFDRQRTKKEAAAMVEAGEQEEGGSGGVIVKSEGTLAGESTTIIAFLRDANLRR